MSGINDRAELVNAALEAAAQLADQAYELMWPKPRNRLVAMNAGFCVAAKKRSLKMPVRSDIAMNATSGTEPSGPLHQSSKNQDTD